MKKDLKTKGEEFWKKRLTPEQYKVLREKRTEAPFTGEFHDNKEAGMYRCAACGFELFSSEDKFDSGTGWPSFTKPLTEEAVETEDDRSFGTRRTEVLCPRCGGHLGHVFDDGPTKMSDGRGATGKRYCINSCALDFKGE